MSFHRADSASAHDNSDGVFVLLNPAFFCMQNSSINRKHTDQAISTACLI